MNISQEGKEFLTKLEGGMFLHCYIDSGGEPTIGIGHLLTHGERASGKVWTGKGAIKYIDGITVEQCHDLLERDLKVAMNAVNTVWVPLNQHQFDALVSFVFNIGIGAFYESTLFRLLNQGDYDSVPGQMRRWIYDNGNKVQGLINRREKEIDFWNGRVSFRPIPSYTTPTE